MCKRGTFSGDDQESHSWLVFFSHIERAMGLGQLADLAALHKVTMAPERVKGAEACLSLTRCGEKSVGKTCERRKFGDSITMVREGEAALMAGDSDRRSCKSSLGPVPGGSSRRARTMVGRPTLFVACVLLLGACGTQAAPTNEAPSTDPQPAVTASSSGDPSGGLGEGTSATASDDPKATDSGADAPGVAAPGEVGTIDLPAVDAERNRHQLGIFVTVSEPQVDIEAIVPGDLWSGVRADSADPQRVRVAPGPQRSRRQRPVRRRACGHHDG